MTRAAGIGRATIYRQMGNKEGLMRYVIGREFDRMRAPPGLEEGPDAHAVLTRLSRAVLDQHLTPRSIALHHLMIQEARLFPDLAREFHDIQIERIRSPFEQVLERAGLPKPSAGVVRAYHVLATCGVRYIGNMRTVDSEERDRVSAETASIILGGLMASQA